MPTPSWEAYATGKIDRLDVAYTKFISSSKQEAVVETLLPLGSLDRSDDTDAAAATDSNTMYDFLPTAESILEEVVPASFRVKLFKCFLDAAVSEQIARMVAMKSATENASDMIKQLSRTYQSSTSITNHKRKSWKSLVVSKHSKSEIAFNFDIGITRYYMLHHVGK